MNLLRNLPLRRLSKLLKKLPPSQLLRRRPRLTKMFRMMRNLTLRVMPLMSLAVMRAKNQARRATTLEMRLRLKVPRRKLLRRRLPKSEDY